MNVLKLGLIFVLLCRVSSAQQETDGVQSILSSAIVNGEAWVRGDVTVQVKCFADAVKTDAGNATGAIYEENSTVRFLFDYEKGKLACYILSRFEVQDFGATPKQEIHNEKGLTWSAASVDFDNNTSYYISHHSPISVKGDAKAVETGRSLLKFFLRDYRGLCYTGKPSYGSLRAASTAIEGILVQKSEKFRLMTKAQKSVLNYKTILRADREYPAKIAYEFDRRSLMPTAQKSTYSLKKNLPWNVLQDRKIEWLEKDGVFVPKYFRNVRRDSIPHLRRQERGMMNKTMEFEWNSFGKNDKQKIDENLFSANWVRNIKDVSKVTVNFNKSEKENGKEKRNRAVD